MTSAANQEQPKPTVSKRRVMRSLLPRIRQLHDDETYRYAETLFDKMDELDGEIRKKEEERDACNKVLTRLIFMTSKPELMDDEGE